MADLIFTNSNYLWLLTLVPFIIIIHFFTLRHTRTAIIKFANFEAMQRVAKGDILGEPHRGVLRNKNIGLLILRAMVYCLLILSVAGTILIYEGQASEFDFVIALDTSSSMFADDFKPSRLEAARVASNKFVESIPRGTKVGLVTFASTAISNSGLTENKIDIKNSLFNVDLYKSGGTAIGDAIITSTNTFIGVESQKSKAIILLTDGQYNIGTTPEAAMEYAKQNAVTIHSIGVATKEGGVISALNLVSTLDDELLKMLSENTNGDVYIVDDIEGLDNAFANIAKSEKRLVRMNISWILLLTAIALLGLEWIFINTIYKTIP